MKVRDMIGGAVIDPRGDIEFDEQERDRYVGRFISAMNADVQENVKAEMVNEIHLEVCSKYDLYIAINDALGSRYARAIKAYINLWKSAS